MPCQGAGELVTSDLAALVGIEDLRSAIKRERFLERLDINSASIVLERREAGTGALSPTGI
jgi:hypothetical protein